MILSTRIKIVIALLLFVILIMILLKNTYEGFDVLGENNNNNNINININTKGWNRNECSYIIGETIENIFKKYNIKKTDNNWDIYLPCNYDDPKIEIEKMPIINGAKYFIIDDCDKLVAKNLLWDHVVKHYGLERAKTMLPPSYQLYNEKDMKRFDKKEYDPKKLYIMKKNIQRQEGLKITNNKKEILEGKNDKYVIVQELLQNPYTIDKRKIDMRFYVLVVCKNKHFDVYVHREGFMYYTKVPYENGSIDKDTNVTTGYIDRSVYEKNPLTHGDMRKYLDDSLRSLSEIEQNIRNQGLRISDVFFQRIYYLIRNVFMSFVGYIGTANKFENNIQFQLFGIDVAINDQLNPLILEINKGPDMNAKDERDSQVKHMVMGDIFRIINVIDEKNTKNGFIQVIKI